MEGPFFLPSAEFYLKLNQGFSLIQNQAAIEM